ARIVFILVFGCVVGAVSSLAAIGFVEAIDWLNDLLLISPRSQMIAGDSSWVVVATVLVPAIGGLIVGIIVQFIPEKRPHGPPDVIRAVQGFGGHIPSRGGVLTALASMVGLGCGASVGQYGPLTHMGATIGAFLSRFSGSGRSMGTVGVGCGVAAAISTVFNAPIAGIVFAHEIILRHYSLRAFAPITVSSTVGYILVNVVFERNPLFRVEDVRVLYAPEFLGFVAIGVVGALVAVIFMRSIQYFDQLSARLNVAQYLKPMLAGACVGIVAIWIPDILGIGRETLRFAIIEDAFTTGELAITLIAKIAATALCIGFGFAGGVFSPALLIGILFGALVGSGLEIAGVESHSDLSIYAICGMAAVTSPVIGAPLTSILIVFELTRNYGLTTAVMVSVVFSNVVAYRVFGRSLFDVQLKSHGFDLSFGRDKVVLDHRTIENYVTQSFTQLTITDTLSVAKKRLLADSNTEAYVVSEQQKYVGMLTLMQLLNLEQTGQSFEQAVGPFARTESLVFTQSTTIWAAMNTMEDFVGESIPVVHSDEHRTLIGVVYEASIVKAYLDTITQMRAEEHGSN
ncbi:MAG: chloride channel protein, partial [Gammaproteobacteria bacterium]|nr:chloride channel protein [Gammaproteobacteria bacterium]